jgi:hypothetical protein
MIKRILNFTKDDWTHLSWLFKNMIEQFLLADFHEAKEAYYWIIIHLSYDSKKIKK